MIHRGHRLSIAACLALAGGCTPVINLPNPTAPRFLGAYASLGTDTTSAPIRIVTFNIKLSRRIDRAAEVLSSDSLRGADILALEEMNDVGVDRIARALHLNYVYYPSFIHPTDHTYFGPAVLSRWPITRSWKLFLPHLARSRGQRRTATVAEMLVRGRTIRVYAVHLETPSGASEHSRVDQVRTILADAATFPGPVVIAGDMNGYAVGVLFERAGYQWVTKRLERTISYFALGSHLRPRPGARADGRQQRGGSAPGARGERPPPGLGSGRAGRRRCRASGAGVTLREASGKRRGWAGPPLRSFVVGRPIPFVFHSLPSGLTRRPRSQPNSSRTIHTAMIIADPSAMSPTGTACLVFRMFTAPKYTAMT